MDTLGYYADGGLAQTGYDQAGHVTADLACRRCGANLRGQHVAGRCPQCGTPTGVTLYGDLLRYADPGWLAAVRRGLLTVLWAAVALAAALLIVAAVGVLLATRAVSRATATTAPAAGGSGEVEIVVFAVATGGVVLVGYLVALYGTWLMTRPDPAGAGEAQYGKVRRFIRGGMIASVIITGIHLAVGAARSFETDWVDAGFDLLSGALSLALFVALAYYLGQLAGRIPDWPLAKRARVVMWGGGISFGLMVLVQLAVAVLLPDFARDGGARAADTTAAAFMAASCSMGLVMLAVLGFGVFYLVLVGQTAGRFRQAREYAAGVWASPGGTAAAPPVAGPPAGA